MPLDRQAARRIAASLADRAGTPAGARQVADKAAQTWADLAAALTPVIGQRGVAALYWRCLHLCRPAHPCLAELVRGEDALLDLAPLTTVLAAQAADASAAVAADLLQTLHELLVSLIGPSLTERLLGAVWAPFLSGTPAQDNPR